MSCNRLPRPGVKSAHAVWGQVSDNKDVRLKLVEKQLTVAVCYGLGTRSITVTLNQPLVGNHCFLMCSNSTSLINLTHI